MEYIQKQKMIFILKSFVFVFIISISLFPIQSFASFSSGFAQKYNLVVHNKNKDTIISRAKTLEVLLKYYSDKKVKNKNVKFEFSDVKKNSSIYFYVNQACQLNLFNCNDDKFFPNENIKQKTFLDWFFKLKYYENPKYLINKYPNVKNDYIRNFMESRFLNLFDKTDMTYSNLEVFLYRNYISEKNLNEPYTKYMAIDLDKINADNFHNIHEINFYITRLYNNINILKNTKNFNKKYFKLLEDNYEAFKSLRKSLRENPYILRQNNNFDDKSKELIKKYYLQDILISYSYNYSKNAAYRRYNLTTGVKKMHNKVFLPGEVMNYWKILSNHYLREFLYGWVIKGSEEEWKFGGGICGSSSMVFLPSWKVGLEILERKNHSKYFSYLYPMENIGLDSTVYRPNPNLKIRNNFNDPILYIVNDDKKKRIITISIIGNKPYKDIKIEGPIYRSRHHIQWKRTFEYFNKDDVVEFLDSRYNEIH